MTVTESSSDSTTPGHLPRHRPHLPTVNY